jgi:16S rRNA (adenine1518-N6/adenine1519-N6)-dimethyltransferase
LTLKKYNLINNEYKIIANIPYNITGAIFKKFLSEEIQPSKMVILVQKEVAMRIVANDKKESILSLSVKAYGTPKYIMKVNKRFFSPAPKVDSAIIAISNISKLNFKDKKTESNFFNLIKTGFGHKRKVLKKNLELIIPKDAIEKSFLNLKIDPKSRAEDLPLDIWLKLTKSVDTSIGNL